MAKFAIECPKCGSVNTASTFVFAKKVIQCGTCGEDINIKESRLTSKVCPHCGKVFVYDQAKSNKRRCPACGEEILNVAKEATAKFKMKNINCPQCACSIEVDSTLTQHNCPICDCVIDVQKELKKAELVSDTGISVIQYEGDNSTFVWKHPIEDFNMGSQLVVHESQEAIFFLNGEALDTFGPGRHTLETENLPVLKKIYSLPSGEQTPFHAEVYFINKTVHMGMKWGTDSRVRFIDPITGIPLDIGASGEMNLQVVNGRKLLIKLVGTSGGLTDKKILSGREVGTESNTVHKTLQGYFRAPLMTEIKSYLSAVIKEKQINILEIDQHMPAISEELRQRISPKFEEYGLTIPQFYISNISLPDNDPNFKEIRSLISEAYLGVRKEEVKASVAEAARQRQIIEEQTKAQLEIIRAQGKAEAQKTMGFAEAEVMKAKGYTEKDVMEADVQKAYAAGIGNMGSGSGGGGGVASDLIGLVAGLKVMDGIGDRIGGALNPTPAAPAAPVTTATPAAASLDTWDCSCGHTGNKGKFCEECGAPKPAPVTGWDCPCGHTGNKGKFCEECGAPKPVAPSTWNCTCGQTDNTGKCCPNCGSKRPE